MTKVKLGNCLCEVWMMSDRKTVHAHFCEKHGGPEKNYFQIDEELDFKKDCDEEPDDLSCLCEERKFTRDSKKPVVVEGIKPLGEAGLKILQKFIRMYPGTEVTWKLHKKEWPIEIEAPTQLEFPCEKIVTENGVESIELEYSKRVVFQSWGHLLWHIRHGIRPYKTIYDSAKQRWVPSEPLTLNAEDVV